MGPVVEPGALPEHLLTLDTEHRYEWVGGQLREKPLMGAESNRVATVLICLLGSHAAAQRSGLVFSEGCGYQIFPDDPKKVRKPDASFIARGRLPGDRPPRGHVQVPPDLAVEVVSPNDLAEEIDARVADYLSAGVRLLWVIYPVTRSITVFRKDGSAARLTESQDLSGEDVLQGFTCKARALFADIGNDTARPSP